MNRMQIIADENEFGKTEYKLYMIAVTDKCVFITYPKRRKNY